MRDAKLRAAVARSTCRSQNAKKYLNIGTLLDVELLKKRTPLWREAHLEVKMIKTLHVRSTFGSSDVLKLHVAVARSTFGSQNRKKLTSSGCFWTFKLRFAWQAQGILRLVKSELNVRVL
jgi:hypothetical protein